MAVPNSRATFKEYVLRKLGKGVLRIQVTDEQIDDRIDEALKYYYDYHFDGSEKQYYKHLITAQDKTNKYITLPENIIGAVRIFQTGTGYGAAGLFDVKYQFMMQEVFSLSSVSLVPYYMAMTHIQMIEQLLIGEKPIRYNRHTNKLYLDGSWELINEGTYLLVEAYEVIDPDTYTDAWGDRWLQRYAEQLIKRQWGTNTKRYGQMKLPDGTTFNGQIAYDEAMEDIKELEHEMINSYSLPANMMIG